MSELAEARAARDAADEALRQAIADAYLNGATIRAIQAETRLSAATILKIKDRAGIEYRRGGYVKADVL